MDEFTAETRKSRGTRKQQAAMSRAFSRSPRMRKPQDEDSLRKRRNSNPNRGASRMTKLNQTIAASKNAQSEYANNYGGHRIWLVRAQKHPPCHAPKQTAQECRLQPLQDSSVYRKAELTHRIRGITL